MLTYDDMYSVYSHRSFSGYTINTDTTPKQHCDVLCVGTCDIASIRPEGQLIFSWYDILSSRYNCQPIGLLLPFDVLIQQVDEFIETFGAPKIICFTVPIPAFLFQGKKLFGVTINSKRTIRYLQLKRVFDDSEIIQLNALHQRCQMMDAVDVEKYYVECFKRLFTLTEKKNITLLWTFNPTVTLSSFLDKHGLNTFTFAGHVGTVANIDSGPDSSMGAETQKLLSRKYINAILERSSLH